MQYDRALRYVLGQLHKLIGQPVIEKLHELNIPEQSRIWWCPTSVLGLSSSPCDGPNSVEGQGQKVFFRRIHIIIDSNALCTHQVSRAQRTNIGSALIADYCATRQVSQLEWETRLR